MKHRTLVTTRMLVALFLVLPALQQVALAQSATKPRVIVLTDIGNEPDDTQSLVRFLVYSNQWDTEGLVATTSIHQPHIADVKRIKNLVKVYGTVQPNLLQHEPGFPSAKYLLSVTAAGSAEYGMQGVGEGKDTRGSELLIAAADKSDARPLWVNVWGGANTLAQALWKVQATRSKSELQTFISKLRVYAISDQDDAGVWIRKQFPDLFYIVSPGTHAGGGYHLGTWTGISGDNFHGRFAGGDFSLVDNPWLENNIRSKGPLGHEYPATKYLMEGDTPAFLNLIGNGLSNPEHPEWGGWGGRYERYIPHTHKSFFEPETRPIWTNAADEVFGADGQWHTSNYATIWRWRAAFQQDFAARMDWTINNYAQANHPPVVKILGDVAITAKAGQAIKLQASASDPDGDAVSYQWFYYAEAGSFAFAPGARNGSLETLGNTDQATALLQIPKTFFRAGSMHFIVAVTDHGSPRLTRYARLVVKVEP